MGDHELGAQPAVAAELAQRAVDGAGRAGRGQVLFDLIQGGQDRCALLLHVGLRSLRVPSSACHDEVLLFRSLPCRPTGDSRAIPDRVLLSPSRRPAKQSQASGQRAEIGEKEEGYPGATDSQRAAPCGRLAVGEQRALASVAPGVRPTTISTATPARAACRAEPTERLGGRDRRPTGAQRREVTATEATTGAEATPVECLGACAQLPALFQPSERMRERDRGCRAEATDQREGDRSGSRDVSR